MFRVEPGIQEFDGETALRYVRSRYSTNDFDRSRRQQIIVRAVKSKLVQEGYLRNPKKIESLFLAVQRNFQTSFTIGEIIQFSALMHDFDSEYQLYSFNIHDACFQAISSCSPGGFLYTPSRDLTGGQSVLLPNGSTVSSPSVYTDIQKFVHLVVSYPQFTQHTREIHVFNASRRPGIANRFAVMLKSFGFNVPNDSATGNATVSDPDKSFLYYDASLPVDDPTLEALSLIFYGEQIPESMPVFAEV